MGEVTEHHRTCHAGRRRENLHIYIFWPGALPLKAIYSFPTTETMASHTFVEILDDFRYEDGDVIVQISEHPSGIFVVHSDVLCDGSYYFRAMFNDYGWSASRVVRKDKGEAKKIWHLQMFFDREQGMCFLTDNVSSVSPNDMMTSPLMKHS